MVQSVAHFLHSFVGSVCVRIDGKAKSGHCLDLHIHGMGDEALGTVLRQGTSHSCFSSVVH